MSSILHNVRKNGRFVKKSRLERELKSVAATLKKTEERKQRLALASTLSDDDQAKAFAKDVMDGRRVVDISILWRDMYCFVCRKGLCFRDIVKERSRGMAYIWTLKCPYCLMEKCIETSSTYVSLKSGCTRHVVNAKLMFGMNDSDIGPWKLNTLLTALNIPHVDPSTLKRAQEDVGPAVASVAEQSCMEALIVERDLTIKSPLKLTGQGTSALLPAVEDRTEDEDPDDPGISLDTDANISTPAVTSTPFCSAQSAPASDPTTPSRRVAIAVSTDMQYSTRFNNKRYDSLTGQSTIVGHKSKKICGYRVITRKCRGCERKVPHSCLGVFKGSAKAMEPEAAVQLIVKNPMLEKAGVIVKAFAGDDDASSLSAVKKASNHHIEKWSDYNHTKKALSRALYRIKNVHSQFDHGFIKYFLSCFGAAVKQNRNNVEGTRQSILSIVPHAFGDHSNCGDWCGYRKDPTNFKHKHFLKSSLVNTSDNNNLQHAALQSALDKVFKVFAAKAEALAPGASSQKNESANNVFASKSSKRTFTGGTLTHFYKVSGGVCQVNEGTMYQKKVYEKLQFSPSTRGLAYRTKRDAWRARVAKIKLSVAAKARRRALTKMRNTNAERQEQCEGVVYESNMAFHHPTEDSPCGGEVMLIPEQPIPPISDVKFVFFDTETNGYGQIIQIAAKLEGKKDQTFSAYAYPMNGISELATMTNRLSLQDGELCYNGQRVECTSLVNCLRRFLEFLRSLQGPVVLVAHNAEFDLRHTIDSYADYFLLPQFADLVVGATDTIPLMKINKTILRDVQEALKSGASLEGLVANTKRGRPKSAHTAARSNKKKEPRKIIPVVSQSTLAKRYIPNFNDESAHEALYDCIILEDLCCCLDVSRDDLGAAISPLAKFVKRRVELQNRKKFAPGLAGMIIPKVISAQTVNKLAELGFTLPKLSEKCRVDGEQEFAKFLKMEVINRGPSVEAIVQLVKKNCDNVTI